MLKPHTLSVQRCPAACRRSKRCSPLLFREQSAFLVTNRRVKKPHSLANTSRVRHRQHMHMAARRSKETAEQLQQGTWRLIALKRLLFRQTPDGHETMQAASPKRQPEQVPARRERDEHLYQETIVPGGQETKSERVAIAEQVSMLFLLKLKSVISALSLLEQTFSWSRERMEANGGSTLLLRLVFRLTRDQERMATHYSEELQRKTAGIGCRNSHLKSTPTGHCHMSDRAQTTRTFFLVEGTHVHWQATAEQFGFGKFNIMFIK